MNLPANRNYKNKSSPAPKSNKINLRRAHGDALMGEARAAIANSGQEAKKLRS